MSNEYILDEKIKKDNEIQEYVIIKPRVNIPAKIPRGGGHK